MSGESSKSNKVPHSEAVPISRLLPEHLIDEVVDDDDDDEESNSSSSSSSPNRSRSSRSHSRLDKLLSQSPQFRVGGNDSNDSGSPAAANNNNNNLHELAPQPIPRNSSVEYSLKATPPMDDSTIPRTLVPSMSNAIFNEDINLDLKNESKVGFLIWMLIIEQYLSPCSKNYYYKV